MRVFQLQIGRSTAIPFFIDLTGNPFIFDDEKIVLSPQHCVSRKEPLSKTSEKCSWCQIDDSDMREAAQRNPYRIYENYGLLDSYIAKMDNIGRNE